MDNLENKPRQERCTLATGNSPTYHGINRHMRSNIRTTTRNPSEEEASERVLVNPSGELKHKASSNGTKMTRQTRTQREVKSGMPNR